MKTTKLVIKDEVNVRFEGLDAMTRRKLVDKLKFFLPYARHTPAYKLGRWDGTVSFCDIGGRSYINLLDDLIPIVMEAGYEIEVEDNRSDQVFEFDEVTEDSFAHIKWPHGHPMAGEPIMLREHQVDLLNSYFKNPQCLSICPTGGGKTLVTAAMSYTVQKYGKSVIIVPTKDLVTQTETDYINMGLDTGVYYGDRKDLTKTHTICTWQSLESLYKKDPETLSEFLEECVCVIVDECHKSKADVLRKLLSGPFGHVPVRWGLTGTLPEEDHERISVKACIGPTNGVIKATDLQEKGILADLHINITQMKDFNDVFDNYQSEQKWLMTNRQRMEAISGLVEGWAESGNTLMLVDRVETGEILQKLLPGSIFINGAVKSDKRKEEYQDVQFSDNKIIIATYGVASTGISINRIFNLVLMEPGKSFVRVIQSIGRGLRVAKDKDFVNVYDLCSTCKYSKRHLAKRKRFYKEAGYPFSVKKIEY